MKTAQPGRPPEPWNSFFSVLDAAIGSPVEITCIGGFVVTLLYGLDRPTADIDVVDLAPRSAGEVVMGLGGRNGPLHRSYGIYLEFVAAAAIPENYEERLVEMFGGAYLNLRLMALDPYDLALTKLERNSQKDRDDMRFLARTAPLELDVLRERYETELRWQLGVPGREDLTLRLWLDAIREDRGLGPE